MKTNGINLNSIDYFSSQLPFLSEFQSSKSWFTQSEKTWNTNNEDSLDLDSDGWVKSLPSPGEASYSTAGTLLFTGHDSYLSGNYVVLYEGEGEIEYNLDATKNEALSSPGRDVIEVDPSEDGIALSITETDPDGTGDYIRDIQVVHEDFESNANAKTFNPEFLNKIQPFNTFRFMDWMETNNSQQKEWADRPKLEDARYSEIGAPVEIMVELANQTNTDPWFTMPHLATDEYVENFASYVKQNLKSDLKVYVEYSNEVWNNNFEQANWVDKQAQQEWSNSDLNGEDWYSKRTTEVVEIWDDVFSNSEKVIGVMAAQSANVEAGERLLDYNWSNDSLSHDDTGIDAIAINAYFGRYIGEPSNEAELKSWLNESDGGLNNLFKEINEGGLLSNSPEGGALAGATDNIKAYVDLAEAENLPLLAYEGGQHLAPMGNLKSDRGIVDLFIEANSDSRMGKIYEDYVSDWYSLGGDQFLNYSDIDTPSESGSWGLLDSVYQDNSPKYNAVVNG